MPTLCDVAGTEYPKTYDGRDVLPQQGISMRPFFENEDAKTEERTLYWSHEINAAIREGNWKLVTVNDRDNDAWELYDLTKDRSETENLVQQHPDVADRLKKKWFAGAEEANVLPYPEDRGNLQRTTWRPPPWPEES